MRILYFSPRNIWPLNGGAPIRDYYLTRELSRLGPVHFLGIRQPGDDAPPPVYPHLASLTLLSKGRSYTPWKLLRGMVGPLPLTVLNYFDKGVATELKKILFQHAFDVVQIEGIHLAQYLPIIFSAVNRPVVICDWHDIESELMSRYSLYAPSWIRRTYARRTKHLLENMEDEILAQCNAHLVVSERERDKLQIAAPHARIYLVENGVDTEQYSDEQLQRAATVTSFNDAEGRHDVVFVGSMDFHANIDAVRWFALQAWPKIRMQHPELRFCIVGARPAQEVCELAALPGVKVTGTVADVRPYYRHAFAAVVPLRSGGGTRLKILEAMAAGVPVVSTRIGAEGLAVKSGANILLGDMPEEINGAFARLCLREQWQDLANAGRELARRHYDWSVIGQALHQVYGTLAGVEIHV